MEELLNRLYQNRPKRKSNRLKQLEKLIETSKESKAFKYDINRDYLYNQHARIAQNQAKRAMENLLAKYATLTQGSPSSFAISSASQEYNRALENFNKRASQYYDRALKEYVLNREKQKQDINALINLENLEDRYEQKDIAAWKDRKDDYLRLKNAEDNFKLKQKLASDKNNLQRELAMARLEQAPLRSKRRYRSRKSASISYKPRKILKRIIRGIGLA